MKKLNDIVAKLDIVQVIGSTDILISSIEFDSRRARPGRVFVAVKGTQVDGHDFIPQVEKSGSAAIVCQEFPLETNPSICYVKVMDSSKALAQLATAFYDFPSKALKLIGVTGTNGKTTIASLLYKMFTSLGL